MLARGLAINTHAVFSSVTGDTDTTYAEFVTWVYLQVNGTIIKTTPSKCEIRNSDH